MVAVQAVDKPSTFRWTGLAAVGTLAAVAAALVVWMTTTARERRAQARRIAGPVADAPRRADEESRELEPSFGVSACGRSPKTTGAGGQDRSFYEGKIAVASFFAKNFLPLLTSTRTVIENLDNEVMELPEAAF